MKVLLVKVLLDDVKRGIFFQSRKKRSIDQLFYAPPLNLLYLGRSLEDEGHSVEVIDFYCERNPMETLRKSLGSSDAVGLSVYTNNCADTAYVAQTIKDSHPEVPIIIGGPHCTAHLAKAMLEVPAADIGVVGDGEQAIKAVINTVQGKKQLSEIPGIYYRDHGKILQGKPPEIIQDLDVLPFPSRHLVDKYKYGTVNNISLCKPKFTSMVTSRGCPFNCRFCTIDFQLKKTYRKRSVENVIEEFQQINEKYGSAIIVDDNFLADTKRVHMIFDRLLDTGINLELFIKGARVDSAERELYTKMKKAGVKSIFYGIESGCQDVLNFYNKGTSVDQIRKAVNLAHEMGFSVIGSFIVGAPIETKQHIEQSIQFACSLPIRIIVWNQLEYRYGSDIWREAVAAGNITENDSYYVITDVRRGLGIFTKEELEECCNRAYRRFYMRPRYFFQELSRMIIKRDPMILKFGLAYIHK